MHVRAQAGDESRLQFFTETALYIQVNVSHVAHGPSRHPLESLRTTMQGRVKKERFAPVRRSGPTDQWNQQDSGFVMGEPETQGMLLVTDKPAALTGLERAPAQGCAMGGISAGDLFLKALVAAGRSVASMSPMPGWS